MTKKIAVIFSLLVLSLVLSLALFACDDNSKPAECEHAWGEWIGTDEGHYHVCSKCDDESKVFSHNCGDTKDIVGTDYIAECKVCKYNVHTPVYPAIEVIDEAQNTTYLAEINQALNALDEVGKSCDISAKMTMYLNNSILSSIDFSCENSNDLYFVINGTNTVIYHEEDGKIFSYIKGSKYDYDRKYICKVDEFLIPLELLGSVDDENSIDLDASKCNITKDGNKYTIQAYATDMMGEEITAQLVEVYQQFGLDSAMLSKITVKTALELTATGYSETIGMDIVMAVEGQIVEIPFEVKASIDYSDIEKIDFFGGEYSISPPSCIEEVMSTSTASDTFKTGQYYAVQLQKGQYYMLCQSDPEYFEKNTYTTGNTMHVYDLQGNEIKSNLDSKESRFYNYNVIIPSEGVYYVHFSGFEKDVVTLVKCDYETIYDVANPKTFSLNSSGVIEGLYDIENYVFTSERDESLLIKNTSDIELIVVVNESEYALKSGKEELVSIKQGDNQIIVTAKNITEKTNYSLECREFYELKGIDLNNLEVLSEEWSGDYTLSLGIGERFFKLHVEEKGYYSLDVQVGDVYGESSIYHVETGFYDGTDYRFSNGEMLEAGDYIVWIGVVRYSTVVLNANVKYTFTPSANEDVEA